METTQQPQELTGHAILAKQREHARQPSPIPAGRWAGLSRVAYLSSGMNRVPMSAGHWAWMVEVGSSFGGPDCWRWTPPATGVELLVDGFYVRAVGISPRGRHIHYRVLGEKRRRWMRTDQFMREATVAGFFKRAPSGELVWIEPMEDSHAPV